ncbi:HAMP domain-containing protein [Pseudomonas aeruginosa]
MATPAYPLTDMGRAMQDIAQGEGDLTKRLKVTSNDEFGTLANAFNRFVERIHESIREVAGPLPCSPSISPAPP